MNHPLKPLSEIPCTALKGVGTKMSERLAKCGIRTIQDMLFHLPYRYQDRTKLTSIGSCRSGDHVVIEGVVEAVEISRKRRPSLLCRLRDSTGVITLRFFHFTASQSQSLVAGKQLRCIGEVRGWSRNDLEIIHPEYRAIHPHETGVIDETLTPLYPTTEGLHQATFRTLTTRALEYLNEKKQLPDYLPDFVLTQLQMQNLHIALETLHRPPKETSIELLEAGVHPAQQRLAFEELLAHHLSLQRTRGMLRQYEAPLLAGKKNLQQAFLNALPFSLTDAQKRVADEITQDLNKNIPMLRLVQGDVGSGKTVVAALASLQAVESGYQVAFMVPTELLAEQHYQNFHQWLQPLGVETVWLTGKLQGKMRKAVMISIESGVAQIIIGTHALFQQEVSYQKLGLVIVDEQHRFGVSQRSALREKGVKINLHPHQLIMTATPIPRTLAMTAYADLDHSIIDTLPPGRTPVKTVAISNERRHEVMERIQHACAEGRQVYWVCTLIEESEVLQCQAAEVQAAYLKQILPQVRISLVHGRMKSAEKEQVMQAFKKGQCDLLVATTVIEVGVDVPNASLMIIENPERLGLSQLHQLRGRVGRGSTVSFCVLLYQQPLSYVAKQRLSVLRDNHDGFEIARRDLELRGPGEVLGTKQTGIARLKVADIVRDQKLLEKVHETAKLLENDENRVQLLIDRWLGGSEHYGNV